MKLRVMMMGLFGLMAVVVAAGTNNAAVADDPSIKEIMKAVNGGKESLKAKIPTALKAKTPDWDALKAQSQELVKLAAAMAKNKQPKGSDESWAKLCKEYLDNATALEAAVGKKDAKTALAACGKFFAGNTCGTCHKAHKP